LRSINGYLRFLDRLLPIWVPTVPAFYRDHTWTLLAGLGALALASPWLWDALLRLSAGLQPLSTRQLTTHSDEAVQGLRRRCLQHNWPFPRLGLLPTSAPLIFSYGWLPRYARLVVSQGLLEQLAADEIAALYAYETSHWRHWDWPLFSLQGLLLQGLHQGYWRLAGWGNRQPLLVKFAAGVLANLSYGLFWLLQKGGVWAARVRVYYCDRTAVEITGNPNGLGRALDKLALGLSQAVDQQGYTPPLIESLDLLLPVGLADAPGTATPPGVNRFAWDALNPLRGWLSINQGHPPLGDRLQLLGRYARYWRLAPELDFEALFKQYGTPTPRLSRTDWRELLLTGAPWFGAAAGGAIALLLWGVGAIARAANYPPLDWLYQDSSLLKSGLLLGLGTGLVLRFNRLFPDLPTTLPATAEQLPDWLSQPDLSPLASLPTQLSGELLTRPGIANWLSQEFWLRTPYGLIKLQAGPEILSQPASDHTSSVQVRGWFRRGHRAWIDLDRLRRTGQPDLKGRLPLWTVGLLALFWGNGLWILFRGTP
jgi:Zn-dependent protease with chaperone function